MFSWPACQWSMYVQASTVMSSTAPTVTTAVTPLASSAGTAASASPSAVSVSAPPSLSAPMQGVSVVITPVAKNPRRPVANVTQVPQAPSQTVGSSSNGSQSTSSATVVSSGSMVIPQSEAMQSSGIVATAAKSGAVVAQSQAPPKVRQKPADQENAARAPIVQTSSLAAPAQEQVSQPLLPLPPADQKQQVHSTTVVFRVYA